MCAEGETKKNPIKYQDNKFLSQILQTCSLLLNEANGNLKSENFRCAHILFRACRFVNILSLKWIFHENLFFAKCRETFYRICFRLCLKNAFCRTIQKFHFILLALLKEILFGTSRELWSCLLLLAKHFQSYWSWMKILSFFKIELRHFKF